MTNATIILNESFRLMEEGKLNGSGQFAEIPQEDGSTKVVEMPEAIHTFNGWKERGYHVKKGEKSSIRIPIWKHSTKTIEKENGEVVDTSNMFMKTACFFTFSQVEPIKERE